MQASSLIPRADSSRNPLQCTPEEFTVVFNTFFFVSELFGTHLGWLLVGFIVSQAYTYHTRKTNDHPAFSALVYCSVFVAMIETAFEGFVGCYLLVTAWGNPLATINTSATTSIMDDMGTLFDALPAVFVQFFFIWRIWTFCMAVYERKVKLLVAGICLFLVLTTVCAFISGILVTTYSILADLGHLDVQGANLLLVWMVATALVDVVITICMIIILYHSRASATSEDTYDKISRLLRLTIQTGFLTSALAVVVVPLFLVSSNLFALPTFLLGKSYVVALLANLNSRSSQAAPVPNRGNKRVAAIRRSNSGGGVLSSLRFVARSIHRNLTSAPNEGLSGGNFGREEVELQTRPFSREEEPGSIHEDSAGGSERPS